MLDFQVAECICALSVWLGMLVKNLDMFFIQTILDQIAAPPIKGSLVFPGIYGDAQTPIEKSKRVAMEDQNIKKRVRRLVKSMGHSVDSNITNRYIDAFPLAQQMEFNSRLLKLKS